MWWSRRDRGSLRLKRRGERAQATVLETRASQFVEKTPNTPSHIAKESVGNYT